MFAKALTTLVFLAAEAAAKIYYAGVAESGGEFAVWSMRSSEEKRCRNERADLNRCDCHCRHRPSWPLWS